MSNEDEKHKRVQAVQKRRLKIKQKSVLYKGGKCIICGYDKYYGALEFHHLNPNEKDFGIAQKGVCRSWNEVQTELDKCICVCSNCHREIHHGIVNTNEINIIYDNKDYLEFINNEKVIKSYTEEDITCPQCGEKKYKDSKVCNNCYKDNKGIKNKPNKEELFKLLIEYRSLTKIGNLFETSNTTIKSLCIKYNLPYILKDIKNMV